MRQQSREYIIILVISAVLVINYPVLDLFDRPWAPFGIPLLYFYLYLAWMILIIVLIAVVESSEVRQSEEPPKPGALESESASRSSDSSGNPPAEQP